MNLEELIETLQNKYLDFKLGEEQKMFFFKFFYFNKQRMNNSIYFWCSGFGKKFNM